MAAYKQFGNGYKPDLTDPNSFENFADGGLKGASGFFTFPVCTADEAWANFGSPTGMVNNPNYPCNPP